MLTAILLLFATLSLPVGVVLIIVGTEKVEKRLATSGLEVTRHHPAEPGPP